MYFMSITALIVFANICDAQTQYTATNAADVAAAKATAKTLSPTSHVKGKTFDRIVQIWCENTDFDMAAGDRKSLPTFSKYYTDTISIFSVGGKSRHNSY
jgi:hypothetical protein